MDKLDCKTSELKESQALDQFREWIRKHPKIKKCRTDDQFLIRFLRVRKFNILEANQLLEKYLTARKQLPHLFENLSIEDPKLDIFVSSYGFFPLLDKDSQGRIILFYDSLKLNVFSWTTVDGIRFSNMIYEHMSFDETSQTKGIVLVFEASLENSDFLRVCTPKQIKEYFQCIHNSFPVRVKKICFVNMSAIWKTLFQLLKVFLSDKMESRIGVKLKIYKGWDEVFKELGTKKFPSEVGGEIPASELAEDFKKRLLENQENILSLSDLDIEISNTSGNFSSSYDAELDAGIVGSFRKIAFD